MHYLIDGHNLIARISDIDLADPDDEAQLILRLKRWTAADRRRHVTVFFDRGLPGGRDPHFSGGAVEVIFTPSGAAADDLLIGRIGRVHNPPEYTLVSSDREVVSAAERRRMPTLDAETFAEQMAAEIGAREGPRSPAAPEEEPLLSEEEVAQWMELFGPGPEEGGKAPERPKRPRRPRERAQKRERDEAQRPPSRPADELKGSGAKLTEDEVAQWLDLFSDDAEEGS